MKNITLLSLFLLLVSCNNNKTNVFIEDKVPASEQEVVNSPSLLDDNIDVQEVKRQVGRRVTTSFISDDNSKIYSLRKNHYASYMLINDFGKIADVAGTLIVYDSINPKIYDKTTDEFVEICLNQRGVSLYNGKVEVGMHLNKLLDLMGADYKKLDNSTFLYEKGNKKAFFKVEDSVLKKLRIGVYREGIAVDTILSYTRNGW